MFYVAFYAAQKKNNMLRGGIVSYLFIFLHVSLIYIVYILYTITFIS